MISEDTFRAALDATPNDHALRLIFADWLEEQGDWRAAGYRWMGKNRRAPFHLPNTNSWVWCGWTIDGDPNDFSELPAGFRNFRSSKSKHLSTGITCERYQTLKRAEEAICRAISEHPELAAEPLALNSRGST